MGILTVCSSGRAQAVTEESHTGRGQDCRPTR
nr:MAG TPA: hypothetical protein [Caudoviricetes sp.]